MSRENVEIVRRSFEGIREGRPAWELYAEDFRLVNLPDAPWQPSPGHKRPQEWVDFSNDVAKEWGADLVEIEALDSERVLMVATWWGRFRATGIRDEQALEAAGLQE